MARLIAATTVEETDVTPTATTRIGYPGSDLGWIIEYTAIVSRSRLISGFSGGESPHPRILCGFNGVENAVWRFFIKYLLR